MDLERIKRLDPRPFAISIGFSVDKRESWRTGTVLRRGSDKIVVSIQPDGHWTYFSFRDEHDNGSAIDLAMRKEGLRFAQAVKRLGEFNGQEVECLPVPVAVVEKDRREVEQSWMGMRAALRHSYLENERWITPLALQHWRFRGRIKTDRFANAVFGHWDENGLTGFEMRNYKFRGFSPQGWKSLWLSKAASFDRRLVICESAIDAISYSIMNVDGAARFVSLAGTPSLKQRDLLRIQMERMPEGSEIVVATDADEAGRKLVSMIRQEFDAVGKKLSFRRHEPPAKDWNAALIGKQARRAEPA